VFRSHAPRAVVAALTAVVLIVGLMASTASAAPKPSANRIIYFGDAPKSEQGNGVLVPSTVSAGNVFEFTLWVENLGSNRLTHAEVGYGSLAVAQGTAVSLPAGATIQSATLNGADCFRTEDNLGSLCEDRGEGDLAIRHYRMALELAPDYADAHFNLAAALSRAGRIHDARCHWQRYVELDAGSPWARIARAHLDLVEPGGVEP